MVVEKLLTIAVMLYETALAAMQRGDEGGGSQEECECCEEERRVKGVGEDSGECEEHKTHQHDKCLLCCSTRRVCLEW